MITYDGFTIATWVNFNLDIKKTQNSDWQQKEEIECKLGKMIKIDNYYNLQIYLKI